MPRRLWMALLAASALAPACSKFERITFVRPSAQRGEYTQVAPTYDVSGKSPNARSTDITQLLMSSSDLYKRGDLAQAEVLAQRALKADPRSGDAHTLLGVIADARGDPHTAGVHYEKAVEIAPKTGLYANNYGAWLCANGRAVESLQWLDHAIADPAYATPGVAFANAGRCAKQAGQPERAEASWRQALVLDPVSAPALSGMAAMKFASGDYLAARAFAERWLTIAPDDPEGLRLAAQIEQKLGDNAAASRYLLRLQAISSGSGSAPRTQ